MTGKSRAQRAIHQQMMDPDKDNIGASLVGLTDFANRSVFASPFGDLQVGQRVADVLVQFNYGVATADATATTANGGTATTASSQLVLASSTATNGAAALQSVNSIQYRPGFGAFAFVTAEFTAGVAGASQRIGAYDSADGYFFGFEGATFGVTRRKGGADTFTAQSSFNLDKLDGTGDSGFTLDPTKLNVYSITYGWLGIAPAVFAVWGGYQRGWVPFHVIDLSNTQSGVSILNPVLSIRAEVVKASGATNIVMRSGSWCGGVIHSGQNDGNNHYFAAENPKTISGGTLTNILTIKNVTTFQGVANLVHLEPVFASAASEGTKIVEMRLLKNATLGGSPSYANVDATNSIAQVDTAGTTVTGGTLLMEFSLAKSGQISQVIKGLGLHLHPGDTLTFAALSANASDVDVNCRWLETF